MYNGGGWGEQAVNGRTVVEGVGSVMVVGGLGGTVVAGVGWDRRGGSVVLDGTLAGSKRWCWCTHGC